MASWRLSFTTSTIFDSTDGDNVTGDCDSPVVKRGNKIIFRCDFGQLLHQFILVKVQIISDKNVRVTTLKLIKSCPKSQRKIILLPRFRRKGI